jgi:hypothetical protein
VTLAVGQKDAVVCAREAIDRVAEDAREVGRKEALNAVLNYLRARMSSTITAREVITAINSDLIWEHGGCNATR